MPDYCLDHIHLTSPNPLKTAEFYEKHFNAKQVSMRDEGDGRAMAKLDLNGITILISQQPEYNVQFGVDHFGIRTDNLDEAVTMMKAEGVEFTQDIIEVRPDFKVSFLKAPEDVPIALQEGIY